MPGGGIPTSYDCTHLDARQEENPLTPSHNHTACSSSSSLDLPLTGIPPADTQGGGPSPKDWERRSSKRSSKSPVGGAAAAVEGGPASQEAPGAQIQGHMRIKAYVHLFLCADRLTV